MKKLATLMMTALLSLSAWATNYTGELSVDVNGTETSQATTITLEQNTDGTYNFVLKNFVLEADGQKMGVGNIELSSLKGTTTNGFTKVTYTDSVTIAAGDDPTITTWLGPLLGKVPVDLIAKFNGTALVVSISIDMKSTLGQEIEVDFVGSAPATETGDLNGDGKINVEDVTELVNRILAGQ